MIVHGRFSAPAWQTSSLPGVTRDLISFFESIFVNLYAFYQLLHFYQLWIAFRHCRIDSLIAAHFSMLVLSSFLIMPLRNVSSPVLLKDFTWIIVNNIKSWWQFDVSWCPAVFLDCPHQVVPIILINWMPCNVSGFSQRDYVICNTEQSGKMITNKIFKKNIT